MKKIWAPQRDRLSLAHRYRSNSLYLHPEKPDPHMLHSCYRAQREVKQQNTQQNVIKGEDLQLRDYKTSQEYPRIFVSQVHRKLA